MKKMLRSSLSSFFYFGGRLFGQVPAGTRILCYHRVSDDDKGCLTVPVSNFSEQMQHLAQQGYRTVSLGDVLAGNAGEKSVVVTFDDGYLDNYENAFPVMKSFGFKGMIFCVTGWIGDDPCLGLEEIREMQRAGFEFGAHTQSHAHLRSLDPEGKRREIAGAKKKMEDQLGRPCEFFCYPYGEYDNESVKAVKEAGYRGACSNIPGANKGRYPYLLRRTEIAGEDTLDDFKKKLAGAFDLLHSGLHWVRGRA